MKRKFIKKTVSVLLSVLLILTLTLGISAHEIYYVTSGTQYVPIVLKWNVLLNGKAYLKVNADGLNNEPYQSPDYNYALYREQFANVKYRWNNCENLVTVSSVSAGNANVIYTTSDIDIWLALVGEDRWDDVLGTTRLYDSNGLYIDGPYYASISSKKIVKAYIYMNPYIYDVFGTNTAKIRNTFVHETGHALTLGHPNISYAPQNVALVMLSGIYTYESPQDHDKGDIRAKYG